MVEVGDLGEEFSVYVGYVERLFQNFLKSIASRDCNDGSQYFKTLTCSGGSHYEVPNIGTLLGRIEWVIEIQINIQKAREYHEGDNQVCPKSSSLQGMKSQLLQSFFVGKVTNASYQLCYLSLNSCLVVDIYQEV